MSAQNNVRYNLNLLAKAYGLDNYELAKIIGCTYSAIYAKVKPKNPAQISLDEAIKFANYFNVDIDLFVNGKIKVIKEVKYNIEVDHVIDRR